MLVPVFERFAEFGWHLFVEPAETYEFFTVSGVFKRARIDAKLHVAHQPGAQHLVQRSALFDVCLASGLAHLIVAYVRAEEPRGGTASKELAAIGLAPTNYVLKEPIAVQQWTRRRLESIERRVNAIVADDHFHGGHAAHGKEPTQTELEAHIRELNGLRAVAMALVERLKEGTRHVTQLAHGNTSMRRVHPAFNATSSSSSSLDETELSGLTRAGIENLLELLARIQAVATACQVLLWLEAHAVVVDDAAYSAFYASARATRVTFGDQFRDNYGSAISSISTADDNSKQPRLLIETVMQSANVDPLDVSDGHRCPPTQLRQLLQLLHAPALAADVVAFYSAELTQEPLDSYFRLQVALLLYFCLDRAYLSALAPHVHTGVRIAHKMRAFADSFAAALNVRDDMKATLLALWLIENAAIVNTGNHDHVAVLYEHAIALFQQSSALHLDLRYNLEQDVVLHVLETLVHRGECVAAYKVAQTFPFDLAVAPPPLAIELHVVLALELDLWERALTLLRLHDRPDLLEVVLNWLVKTQRMKELVQTTALEKDEERLFHSFMLHAGVFMDADALKDENVRRADLLVMYYVLRHQLDAAWRTHYEHLRLLRVATAGDTQIAAAVLRQPSFQARVALLEAIGAAPCDAERTAAATDSLVRRSSNADVAMDGRDEENDNRSGAMETPRLTRAAYTPGSFSSRASLPRRSSAKTRFVLASDAASDAAAVTTTTTLDSSNLQQQQQLRRRSSDDHATTTRRVVQSRLDFDSPRACDKDMDATAAATFAFSATTSDRAFAGRSSVATAAGGANQPLRSRFNSSFHRAAPATTRNPGGVTTDDLTLKPRGGAVDRSLPTTHLLPVDVQVGSRRTVLDTTSVLLSSTSSTHSSDASPMAFETPKRFQFVRDQQQQQPPMTDSRIGRASTSMLLSSSNNREKSPATAELEDGMELERIDEEFSTPLSRARGRRTTEVPASAPERRNPRRSARNKY